MQTRILYCIPWGKQNINRVSIGTPTQNWIVSELPQHIACLSRVDDIVAYHVTHIAKIQRQFPFIHASCNVTPSQKKAFKKIAIRMTLEKMFPLHNARLRILFKFHWRARAVKVRIIRISARTSLWPELDLPTSLFTKVGELIIKPKKQCVFKEDAGRRWGRRGYLSRFRLEDADSWFQIK